MQQSKIRKIGVWIIIIITSIALIIPAIAIIWSVFNAQSTQQISINPENITITTGAPEATAEIPSIEQDSLSTAEQGR